VHHRAFGSTTATLVSPSRHRFLLAAEREARRRRRHIIVGQSRVDRVAPAADLPLNAGASLIVILMLSLGLWAAIWGAIALSVSVVLG
jgi:hypothetical protein